MSDGSLAPRSQLTEVAELYRDFVLYTRNVSPIYAELAEGVANDRDVLALLRELPEPKRQPNLLFAAARHVAGTPSDYAEFRSILFSRREAVVATMLARRTQTNEPGWCAAVYPLLAALPQPLALLEVGASAGLCLLPDRYAYEYNGVPAGAAESPLLIPCRVEGAWAHPTAAVEVAWRAGIDLNPLSVTDPDDRRWLETLIWPGQDERLRRLDRALAVAQQDPPRVVRGDLNERLADVAAEAPEHATLVVFHTSVLWYLSAADRQRFAEQVRRLGAHWISQEERGVLPSVGADLPEPAPDEDPMVVLALDGRAVALTAPHGGLIRWLEPADPSAS